MIHRVAHYVIFARRAPFNADVEARSKSKTAGQRLLLPPICHWIRANLIIPGAFGTYDQRFSSWCTIPTRLATVVIVAFYFLVLVICCAPYEVFWPNLLYAYRDYPHYSLNLLT